LGPRLVGGDEFRAEDESTTPAGRASNIASNKPPRRLKKRRAPPDAFSGQLPPIFAEQLSFSGPELRLVMQVRPKTIITGAPAVDRFPASSSDKTEKKQKQTGQDRKVIKTNNRRSKAGGKVGKSNRNGNKQ